MECKNFIPTWQIRKPNTGKCKNVNLDILGIAETHWTQEGKIIQENHTMIYSGGEKHRNGSRDCIEEQCSKINDGILGNFR